eukprot:3996316-Pleurochrysis_carterae.AAC.1
MWVRVHVRARACAFVCMWVRVHVRARRSSHWLHARPRRTWTLQCGCKETCSNVKPNEQAAAVRVHTQARPSQCALKHVRHNAHSSTSVTMHTQARPSQCALKH